MSIIEPEKIKGSSVRKRRVDCYQKYLRKIADHLNSVHEMDCDLRYWGLLVGPWLVSFVNYVDYFLRKEDRLLQAEKDRPGYFPYDYVSFLKLCDMTNYPSQLDFDAHNSLGKDNWPFEGFGSLPLDDTGRKKILRKVLNRILRPFLEKASIVLASPHFSVKEQFKIMWDSKFKICPFFFMDEEKNILSYNKEIRKWGNTREEFDNKLDAVLDGMVLKHIPYVYLEGFKRLLSLIPPASNSLRLICSSVSWQNHELFKLFCSENLKKGVYLVGLQHGGHPYGTGVHIMVEQEKEFLDKFLTWGWQRDDKDIPFVSLRRSFDLKEFDKFVSSRKGEYILFATTSAQPNYPDCLGVPSGDDLLLAYEGRQKFVKSISEKVREQTVIRPYPGEYVFGQNQRKEFEDLGLNLRFDENKLILDSLSKAKLVVQDNVYTVFFEVIAYDIPIIVYCKESLWEFNQEFDLVCDEMKKVGMFHTSSESAANFIDGIIDDIDGWWKSPEVREVVKFLKTTYVGTTYRPREMLISQLYEIAEIVE